MARKKRKKKIIIPKEGLVRNERVFEGLYAIIVKDIGIYYGESNNIYRRWSTHKKLLTRGRHHCIKLQQLFKSLGSTKFSFKIIELCDNKVERKVKEEYLVKNDKTSLNSKLVKNIEYITNYSVPNMDKYKNKELLLERIPRTSLAYIKDNLTNEILGIEEVQPYIRLGIFLSDNECKIKRKLKC